jgi:hypothetical protein
MTENSLNIIALRSRSPLRFFLLVFALSLPFFLAGTLTSFQLLPALPVSALAFLCPMTAAAIFVYRENKSAGLKELLKRAFDFKRVKAKIWYVPIILPMPCIMVLSDHYSIMNFAADINQWDYSTIYGLVNERDYEPGIAASGIKESLSPSPLQGGRRSMV